MLVALWKGSYKDLAPGNRGYVWPVAVQEIIGKELAAANYTVPTAFGRKIRDLFIDSDQWTGENWSMFLLYTGPTLLRARFEDDAFYEHFMLLSRCWERLLRRNMTGQDLKILDAELKRFVIDFERCVMTSSCKVDHWTGPMARALRLRRLYVGDDGRRVRLCSLPLHLLLHIPAAIRTIGPLNQLWSWFVERACGRLKHAVSSRSAPFANMIAAGTRIESVYSLKRTNPGSGMFNAMPANGTRTARRPPRKLIRMTPSFVAQLAPFYTSAGQQTQPNEALADKQRTQLFAIKQARIRDGHLVRPERWAELTGSAPNPGMRSSAWVKVQ